MADHAVQEPSATARDLPLSTTILADPELWAAPPETRDEVFARLRAEAPVSWQDEPESPWGPAGRGYWAVVGHADVKAVSRDPGDFISGQGTEMLDLPLEVSLAYGGMLNMDAPRHTRLRHIVARAFTPRMISHIDDLVRREATRAVAAVAERGQCDFAADVAATFPVGIIAEMMGVPTGDDRRHLAHLTNLALGFGDPEVGTFDDSYAAALEIIEYGAELGRRRRVAPADDLTTALIEADVDGDRLTDAEVGSFFELLITAGIETTGTAAAQGLRALWDHPAQLDAWQCDVEGLAATAVDEIVRWSTPVIHFRRTAVRDTEVAGQPIAEGDKVVLWYNSANRDEQAFADPDTFDIARTPNDHVGFGGGGPHFCLGANLARSELKALFEELFRVLPDIAPSGDPVFLASPMINGVKSLPCRFTPARASRL